MDLMKKVMYQGHAQNNQKLIEELGDALWGLAEAATALGLPLSYIAECNVQKLQQRYPEGFSVDRSINREEA